MLLPLGRSPRLLTQYLECLKIRSSETSVKYWPFDTSYRPGKLLSHINTADRMSNFVVSPLKMQSSSSTETSVFTSWHLPSWKTLSHINTADRTSNIAVSTLKIQAPSSSQISIFTGWHLLQYWKSHTYTAVRTSNFVVSTLKMQTSSSAETPCQPTIPNEVRDPKTRPWPSPLKRHSSHASLIIAHFYRAACYNLQW
jgi:hypothetical protein